MNSDIKLNYNDLKSLDNLRALAQKDEKAALKDVAKQFEGIFTQMLFESMRKANSAFETDSPFNNRHTKFYQDMQDQQMSLELSKTGSLGLADLIVQQLLPEQSTVLPASVVRSGADPFASRQGQASAAGTAKLNNSLPPKIKNEFAVKKVELVEKTKSDKISSPQSFVEQLLPLAKKASKLLGVDPAVLLAQSALETGWGKKVLQHLDGSSSHNLFNIKAGSSWRGDKVAVNTLEYKEGIASQQKADFRSYNDYEKSFDDYVHLLTSSKRYEHAVAKTSDPASFLQELQQAGYATDPEYANKVVRVLGKVADMINK